MKKLFGKFKIGEMMSKIFLMLLLIAFVSSMGLLGNKKATAQSGSAFSCEGDTCTFTGDYFIQTDTQFDNKNIIIKALPGEMNPVVTIDGEHTFKNVNIRSGTITHSPVAQDRKPGADDCPTGDLVLQNKITLHPDNFGAKYKGFVEQPLSSEKYSITVDTTAGDEDWARLRIRKVGVSQWDEYIFQGIGDIGKTTKAYNTGLYEFEIDFKDNKGEGAVELERKGLWFYQLVPKALCWLDQNKTQHGVNAEYFTNIGNTAPETWHDPQKTQILEWMFDAWSENGSPFGLADAQGLKLNIDNLTIGSSGKIDVSGKGYPGGCGEENTRFGYGPAGGVGYPDTDEDTHNVGGGGGYGGYGSSGYQFEKPSAYYPPFKGQPANSCCFQKSYGTLTGPAGDLNWDSERYNKWYDIYYTAAFGSGGGGGRFENWGLNAHRERRLGGAGGGLIKIEAQNINLSEGGQIIANGGNGEETETLQSALTCRSCGGGGSGGTIEIHALSWSNINGGSPEVKGNVTRDDKKNVNGIDYYPFKGSDGTIWVGDEWASPSQATDPAVIAQYHGNVQASGGLLGGGGGRIAIDAPIGEAPTPPVSADSRKVKAVITWQEFGKTQTVELWTYLKDVR